MKVVVQFQEKGVNLIKLICIFNMRLPSPTKVLDILLILSDHCCFIWGISQFQVFSDGCSKLVVEYMAYVNHRCRRIV